MSTLNFPCPTCGAMISTVGLGPGRAPSCSACGKVVPAVYSPDIPAIQRGGWKSGVVAILGGIFFLVSIWGLFDKRSRNQRYERELQERQNKEAAAAAELSYEDKVQIRRLIGTLKTGTDSQAQAAWTSLYGYDRKNHWGTFEIMSAEYSGGEDNASSWLTFGFLTFYESRGEAKVFTALVAAKKDVNTFSRLCDCIENTASREGAAVAAGCLRTLRSARQEIDNPATSPRLEAAIGKITRLHPAEER